MHFKILEIYFLEEKSGKNPARFFETGPEPEPDIEAEYPAGTGFSRISGRFLAGRPSAARDDRVSCIQHCNNSAVGKTKVK